MQHIPEYIQQIYIDKTIGDNVAISQRLLATEPQEPADRDYLQTLSIVKIYENSDPHYIIAQCENFLSQMTTPECRSYTQNIQIKRYEQLENYEKAIALRLEKVEEYKKNQLAAEYIEIVRIYQKMEDSVNAIKYYELYMAAENNRAGTEEYEELAELYENVRDYKNSAKYYEMCAAWEARLSADYWQLTGRALAISGDQEEAMFYFRVALKIDPNDPYTHHYMGHYYQLKNDRYRALHHYTQALKLKPDFTAVHINIGMMEFRQEGDIRTAIKYLEEAIEHDSKEEFLFNIYGQLSKFYGEIKEFEKAAEYRTKYMAFAGFTPELLDFLDNRDDYKAGDEDDEDA